MTQHPRSPLKVSEGYFAVWRRTEVHRTSCAPKCQKIPIHIRMGILLKLISLLLKMEKLDCEASALGSVDYIVCNVFERLNIDFNGLEVCCLLL